MSEQLSPPPGIDAIQAILNERLARVYRPLLYTRECAEEIHKLITVNSTQLAADNLALKAEVEEQKSNNKILDIANQQLERVINEQAEQLKALRESESKLRARIKELEQCPDNETVEDGGGCFVAGSTEKEQRESNYKALYETQCFHTNDVKTGLDKATEALKMIMVRTTESAVYKIAKAALSKPDA